MEIFPYKQIATLLSRLEGQFDVNSWKVNGIHCWPLIRLNIAMALKSTAEAKSGQSLKHTPRNPLSRFIQNRKTIADIKKTDRRLHTAKADVLFLTFPHYRTTQEGKQFNQLFDPLAEFLEKSQKNPLILEYHGAGKPTATPYNKEVLIDITAHLHDTTASLKKDARLPDLNFTGLEQLISEVEQESGLELKTLGNNLQELISGILINSQYFRKILQSVKPRLCFVTCYYDSKCLALVAACKAEGIPVADMQHGTQNPWHPSYGFWTKVPAEGYAFLPDLFWCWDEDEARTVNQWALANPNHRAIQGGHPGLWWWKKNVPKKLNNKQHGKLPEDQTKNILFTAQPCEEPFPDFLLDTIRDSEHTWWVRLHPRQNKDILETIPAATRQKIKDANAFPLAAALAFSDVHITLFSSVVLEASLMGKPSILLSETHKDLYEPAFRKNLCFTASDQASLENSLLQALDTAGKQTDQPDPGTVLDHLLLTITDSENLN